MNTIKILLCILLCLGLLLHLHDGVEGKKNGNKKLYVVTTLPDYAVLAKDIGRERIGGDFAAVLPQGRGARHYASAARRKPVNCQR